MKTTGNTYTGLKKQIYTMFKKRPAKGWTNNEMFDAIDYDAQYETVRRNIWTLVQDGTIAKTTDTRENPETFALCPVYRITTN